MRLDRNSLTLFNYALLGVFVLVITINDVYANIFDNATTGLNTETTQNCDTPMTPAQHLAKYNSDNNLPRTEATWYQEARTMVGIKSTYYDSSSNFCSIYYEYRSRGGSINSDGSRSESYNTVSQAQVNGTRAEAPTCENLAADQGAANDDKHSYMGTDSNGNQRCYKPKDIPALDTCEAKDENNAYESHMSQESGVSCIAKDDGSVCPVSLESSITLNSTNSTYNFYSFDTLQSSDSCYQANDFGMNESEPVDDIAQNMPVGDGQCAKVNGIDNAQICNESPSNVCDQNGNCSKGCGTYQFAGESQFICFSNDIDGDTVPDYKDPDRDGDGIHNDQDTDTDGDGVDDAQYEYGSGSSGSTSNIETLLGRIAQNTESMSGGGGSGNSQGVIDAIGELGEQLEESTNVTIGEKGTLYSDEQAQLEIDEATEKLNAKIEQIKEHFSGLLSIGSGTGSFSGCFDIAQINGSKHGGCIDEYADEMSMVAVALLFIFALISVVIILR